jgi:uncharacterized membrane protein
MCGLIRRYGSAEPTVADALLRLLDACTDVAGHDPEIRASAEEEARIIIADAEREVSQAADLAVIRAEADALGQKIAGAGSRPTDRPG